MPPPTTSLLLASASCNRRPGALSRLPTAPHLSAYASSTNVLVLTPPPHHTVLAILPVHRAPVTCVNLCRPTTHTSFILLISAAADGCVAVWRAPVNSLTHWIRLGILKAFDKQPCVSVDVAEVGANLIIVAAGMEGVIKVYNLDPHEGECEPLGEAPVRDGVLLEVAAMRSLTPTCAMVIAGGTDRHVYVFAVELTSEERVRSVGVLEGHRDWVRGLAFSEHVGDSERFYLVSGSKDWTARIWNVDRDNKDNPDVFARHSARVVMEIGGQRWAFAALVLLDEHTGAVHSVAFGQGFKDGSVRLLTASMDCSVAIWEMEKGRWQCMARFGLMGGSSAHALGFFGAVFAGDGCEYVLGHNFAGALHCWRAEDVEEGDTGGRVQMMARSAPGGHFAPVTGLDWEPSGRYLLTCSADKTARIYAEVEEGGLRRFVEWARPQIHGHAISAVAFCDESGRRYLSGAEEKMLRMFEAPSSFQLPGKKASLEYASDGKQRAVGAMVPQLGLSNKATFESDKASVDVEHGDGANISDFEDMVVASFGASRGDSEVPLEEELKQQRLWPETAKLYGHGNEVSCMAVNLADGVLASGCQAKAAKDAAIILWDMNGGVECGRLSVHDLTIHEMRFSKDGNRLLSVSRDRSFAIFNRAKSENRFSLELSLHKKSAHSRLIYCCCWLLGSAFIATGGRDKYLKIFAADSTRAFEAGEEVFKQKFSSGVSAVDALRLPQLDQVSVLGVGFECGHLRIYSVTNYEGENVEVRDLFSTKEEARCGGRINQLQWRPGSCRLENGIASLQMAIGSEDASVRIVDYELELCAR